MPEWPGLGGSNSSAIGITFGASGQEDVIKATQQTSAAVKQANETAATTAKASGDSQVQSSNAVKGAMASVVQAAGAYIGVMALLKTAWDGVKGAMADQQAAARLSTTLENIGLGGGAAYTAMMDFSVSLREVYGVAGNLTVPALTRLVRATSDVQSAMYLSQLAARLIKDTEADYTTIVNALVEAEAGRGKGLIGLAAHMGVQLDKTGSLRDAYEELDFQVGLSSGVMETNAQRTAHLKVEFDELKEGLFSRLMPVVTFATGVFTEFMLVIKTAGDSLGRMAEFIVKVFPQIGVALDPTTWLHPKQMKAVLDNIKFYVSDFARDGKEMLAEFGKEWNRINALAQGSGGAAPAAMELPAGLGNAPLAGKGNPEVEAAQTTADAVVKTRRKAAEDTTKIHGAALKEQLSQLEAFRKENAATAAAISNVMSNSIQGMTNLWTAHFKNLGDAEMEQRNVWADSGRMFLAMVLQQVADALRAKAIEQATLAVAAGAGFVASGFTAVPLLMEALGHGAYAAALGLGSVAAGVGASAVTPPAAQRIEETPAVGAPGDGGGGRGNTGYGGGYSEPRGGQTITNSNVTIYYNPTMVVSGNVYGFDDFRQLVMQFFREYAYIRGTDLAGATAIRS